MLTYAKRADHIPSYFDKYRVISCRVAIKVDLNGGPQPVLSDLLYLPDLPLMLIIGIQVIARLELAVEIIGLELRDVFFHYFTINYKFD